MPMPGIAVYLFHLYLITDRKRGVRALLHDEEVYPHPSKFMPERFLDERGQLNQKVRNPDLAAFGFGRRLVHFDLL